MLCAVCQRPLLDGVTACILCGAPVGPPPEIGAAPDPVAPPMPVYDAYAAPAPPMPAPPNPYAAPVYTGQGYMGQPYAPQVRPLENGFAIASLVCGLLGLVPLWIGFVLCILAIAFGVAGLQRANGVSMGKGRGLAIAGIVLGLVFILPAACGL